MTFWKTQNYRAKKRPVVVRGCWVGKQFSIKEWHGEFWGVEGTALYATVGVDTQFYAFVKTHKTIHHKVNFTVCNKNISNKDVGGNLK